MGAQGGATAIDTAVMSLSTNRNIVSVAVTPLAAGFPGGTMSGAVGLSATVCIIVTVVRWPDPVDSVRFL